MKRYVERIEKEAVQLTSENMAEVMKWCGGTYYSTPPMRAITGLSFFSLGYLRTVLFGEWIMKESNGEFSVYSDDAFVNLFVEAPNTPVKIQAAGLHGTFANENFKLPDDSAT